MNKLSALNALADALPTQDTLMPVLFIGHGSPMNALEDNEFTRGWKAIAQQIPLPTAILCVSAHWETRGTWVTAMPTPRTIHDFGGFPKALFDTEYPAAGSRWLAEETQKAISSTPVGLDEKEWGFDHGTWSILKPMYPAAQIPVVQLSLDATQGAAYHYALAKQLAALRKKGVLIVGSGNMVHNFQYARFSGDFNAHYGVDWAIEANEIFKKLITTGNHAPLISYQTHASATRLAAPTPEHYLPLLYALALQTPKDALTLFNDAVVGGAFSMTSLKIG